MSGDDGDSAIIYSRKCNLCKVDTVKNCKLIFLLRISERDDRRQIEDFNIATNGNKLGTIKKNLNVIVKSDRLYLVDL